VYAIAVHKYQRKKFQRNLYVLFYVTLSRIIQEDFEIAKCKITSPTSKILQ